MFRTNRLARALARLGVVALVGLGLLTGGSGAPSTAPPILAAHAPQPVAEQQRASIKVGSLQLVGEAGVFAALANGYFAEEGIDVELLPFRGTADFMPALATGDLAFSSGPVDPSLFNAIT